MRRRLPGTRCWRSGSDIRGAIEVALRVGGCAVSTVVVEDEVGRLSETVDMTGRSVADHDSEFTQFS